MGEVYSHLSEEERQVIQIEVGNGASIRGIGAMLGRSPSSISREIKRNTWFPSNENESYRPYRPKRLKAGVLLQCLFDRFGSVFPQCGLMVFPGVVIVSR